MPKKHLWFLFKILELLLSSGCCCLLLWRCCQNTNLRHILILCGFYSFSILICFVSLIASYFTEKPRMQLEAGHAGILGALHLVTVYLQLNVATMEACQVSALVALCATAIYLLHCNLALDQMFSDRGNRLEHPLIMPPFYFKRSAVEVYLCEPLPSPKGPLGLPT